MNKLKIVTYSRIHITLVGMNSDGYRRNGGIGFSINKPSMTCVFSPCEHFNIIDARKESLDNEEYSRLINHLNALQRRYRCNAGYLCDISGDIIPHCGFGSSTMLYLSATEALFKLNNVAYNRELLVKESGRGGTSGIGVNTYFEGGFICDLGVKNVRHSSTITPSSISQNNKSPLVMYRHTMPQWEIGICIPKRLQTLSEKEEVSFFKKVRGLQQSEINEILYHSVYGVLSSIEENDLTTFNTAIKNIQSTQWKLLERSNYGDEISKAEGILYKHGADTVGMSSMGPMLFFTGNNINKIVKEISRDNPELECYSVLPNNSPRELIMI